MKIDSHNRVRMEGEKWVCEVCNLEKEEKDELADIRCKGPNSRR